MTPSEQLVSALCKNTFLSFWSFPNPVGKKNKELCDLIVICDPDVIIFSVKDINVKESGNAEVDMDRWLRKAVDASVDQIYGAERIIELREDIFLSDKVTPIKLPQKGIRNIYRVAVAFGRGDKFPLKYGDFSKGFVHVFDERSIQIVLQELDTITDFIDYLKAKEEFAASGVSHISFSSEDMLALYMQDSLLYEKGTLLYVSDDLWEGYSQSEEYKQEKIANVDSYVWDKIIETLHDDFINGRTVYTNSREEIELALRYMNKENRFGRRQLGKSFLEIIGKDDGVKSNNARASKAQVEGTPAYVFLTRPFESRESRTEELQIRCMVARQMFKDTKVVIGIATEKYKTDNGFSLDICYLEIPVWTDDLEQKANEAKDELGIFRRTQFSRMTPDGTYHKI